MPDLVFSSGHCCLLLILPERVQLGESSIRDVEHELVHLLRSLVFLRRVDVLLNLGIAVLLFVVVLSDSVGRLFLGRFVLFGGDVHLGVFFVLLLDVVVGFVVVLVLLFFLFLFFVRFLFFVFGSGTRAGRTAMEK